MPGRKIPASENHEIEAIVDAALDLVFRHGLAGLTLRPLAARVGLSVAIISARMGSKDQLIERVVDTAASQNQRLFDHWLGQLPRIGPIDTVARAALADIVFKAWIDTNRREVIFLIELIHDRALQPAPSPALDRWLASVGMFWSTLVFGSPDHSDLALGYVIDEAGFALGVGGDPIYALLRVLCLQQFAAGLFTHPGSPSAAIAHLIVALQPGELPVAVADDPKRRRIADSAAQIIVSQGVDAVSHRTVAIAAGVPASTVVYHFGGRAALLVAGLHAAIARFHGKLDRTVHANTGPEDDAETRNVAKATAMIALASARDPSLLPYALEMRRRRGDRIRAADLAGMGFRSSAGFDLATAQVIAIATYGIRMVAMARKQPERACYRAAFAAIEAWAAPTR